MADLTACFAPSMPAQRASQLAPPLTSSTCLFSVQ